MNKKLVFIATTIILAIVAGVALYILSTRSKVPTTQEEAIKQAQEYKPEGACLTVLTGATHTATGARYIFPNSCLPDGWE